TVSRTFITTLLKYALAFGLLGYVVWQNWMPGSDRGLEAVWNKHAVRGEPIHTGFLTLAAVVLVVSLTLTVVRWYLLVRAVGLPIRLTDAFRLGLIGFFFNTFLPGSIGGDAVKAVGLARSQKRRTVAVATVIMDRAIALWGLIWFVALFGGAFWWLGLLNGPATAVSHRIILMAAVIVALSVVVWVLLGLLPEWRAGPASARRATAGCTAGSPVPPRSPSLARW